MDGASPSSAGSSSWWVRSVRLGGREESEDPIAGGKTSFLFIKQNKQKQPCRGKTDWQGRAQGIRRLTYGNEPTRNCKHQEIIKGANEESNEGEQPGEMNQ